MVLRFGDDGEVEVAPLVGGSGADRSADADRADSMVVAENLVGSFKQHPITRINDVDAAHGSPL
jgi:hypothetical protein